MGILRRRRAFRLRIRLQREPFSRRGATNRRRRRRPVPGCGARRHWLAAPAIATRRKTRTFWWLWSFSCLLWLGGQVAWTYFEVVLRQEVPNPFLGDVVYFLRAVPIMGALALRPHDSRKGVSVHIAYLDSALLVFWWVYLYVFAVIPWQYVSPEIVPLWLNYDWLEWVENGIVAAGLAYLFISARTDWRAVYLHLLGASLTFAAGAY